VKTDYVVAILAINGEFEYGAADTRTWRCLYGKSGVVGRCGEARRRARPRDAAVIDQDS
jgi:hypothetical protein